MPRDMVIHSLQNLVGWLGMLVSTVGAVMAASYIPRSRWARVLAVAFGLEALVLLALQTLVPHMLSQQPPDFSRVSQVTLGIAVVGLMARGLLVFAIAGVLTRLRPSQWTP